MGTTSIPREGYNTAWLKSTDMPVFSHHIPFHGGIVPEKRVFQKLGIGSKTHFPERRLSRSWHDTAALTRIQSVLITG